MNAFERFDPAHDNPRRWLIDKRRSGGGPMFDFGCHRIEVLINLFGEVTAVRALAGNVHFEREVEDTATALLRFASDTQGVVTVTHAAREPQDRLEIFGSDGSIRIDVLNEGRLRVRAKEGERFESHPPHTNLHQPHVEDFARAVVEGRAPRVDGRIGQKVAEVLELIYAD
jgi:predicted dehydrogenase